MRNMGAMQKRPILLATMVCAGFLLGLEVGGCAHGIDDGPLPPPVRVIPEAGVWGQTPAARPEQTAKPVSSARPPASTTPDAGTSPWNPVVFDAGPLECDESLRLCQHEFSYPVGNESSVLLCGTFARNGWSQGCVPLTKNASKWSATVEVPSHWDVHYQFLVDGKWRQDSQNGERVSDGQGEYYSNLKAQSCASWSCDTKAASRACVESDRKCSVRIHYPFGNEGSVVLRGDFATDGWTAGIAMVRLGDKWTAEIAAPWGAIITYKFFVNGKEWKTSGCGTMPDPYGGKNCVLSSVSCGYWDCPVATPVDEPSRGPA